MPKTMEPRTTRRPTPRVMTPGRMALFLFLPFLGVLPAVFATSSYVNDRCTDWGRDRGLRYAGLHTRGSYDVPGAGLSQAGRTFFGISDATCHFTDASGDLVSVVRVGEVGGLPLAVASEGGLVVLLTVGGTFALMVGGRILLSRHRERAEGRAPRTADSPGKLPRVALAVVGSALVLAASVAAYVALSGPISRHRDEACERWGRDHGVELLYRAPLHFERYQPNGCAFAFEGTPPADASVHQGVAWIHETDAMSSGEAGVSLAARFGLPILCFTVASLGIAQLRSVILRRFGATG